MPTVPPKGARWPSESRAAVGRLPVPRCGFPGIALLSIYLLTAAVGCGRPGEERTPSSRPPDLILVVIDTWRWDALGANGSARAGITPELDALAARGGVRFSRAISSSPWTEPSVATLLTGQYPTIHGAYGRLAEGWGDPSPDSDTRRDPLRCRISHPGRNQRDLSQPPAWVRPRFRSV